MLKPQSEMPLPAKRLLSEETAERFDDFFQSVLSETSKRLDICRNVNNQLLFVYL